MRTWMFLPTLSLVVLVGCRLCGNGDKPLDSNRPAASAAAPVRAGVIPVAPANASIKFTGSGAMAAVMSHDGRFEAFDGALEMPTPDPKDATIHVRVDMSSTTTSIAPLTKHLKGEDFFDVAKYPTAEFVSERIVPTSEAGRYQVTGRFTIHGVSQSVTFPARIVMVGEEVAFDATATISQTAFGMTEAARKTEDEVPVTVSIRGLRK
jgi:polyisoprenoid-binding protein YceI